MSGQTGSDGNRIRSGHSFAEIGLCLGSKKLDIKNMIKREKTRSHEQQGRDRTKVYVKNHRMLGGQGRAGGTFLIARGVGFLPSQQGRQKGRIF